MGFLPKSVGSQSRKISEIFDSPRDFWNFQKNPKNEKMSENEKSLKMKEKNLYIDII